MDSATEDVYFQKIEELIQDEDKIVTIPYLSRNLKIAVQDSEKLLSKYLKDHRKLKPDELSATYILKGIVKEKGSGVFFIKEDNLEEKRSIFDQIDSEILFSVQKCKQIDLNVIALVDDVTKPCTGPLLGSVVGKNCIKRVLKIKKLPTPPPSTLKGKSSFFMPKTDSSSSVEKAEKQEKPETKSKQNGIAGMFAKAAATQSPKDKDTAEKKTKTSKQPSHKGGISAFLSKGSSSSSENGVKKGLKTISSDPSEIEELMEIDFYEEMDETNVDDKKIKKDEENKSEQKEANKNEKKFKKEEEKNKKEVKEKKEQEGKEEKKKQEGKEEKKKQDGKEKRNKNKRQREKSEEKSIKKRKRIVQRNDSESDDMFENDEEDIVDVSEGENERIPSPVASKPLAPKNKIRKAIDNTYMDEEGFIVTKTEYVYESAPEDDEEPKKQKEVKPPKLEKKTSASSENDGSPKTAKNKKAKKNNLQNQPTLMNFFKKK